MTKKFTHFDDSGNPNMVDINDKKDTKRLAIAVGKVVMQKETLKLINKNKIKKGDVFQVANIAGIQGAKKTDNLIPLCHSLPLSYVKITFLGKNGFKNFLIGEAFMKQKNINHSFKNILFNN